MTLACKPHRWGGLKGRMGWVPGAAIYLLVALMRLREMLGEDREPAAA